jgi:hypothetical protein
VRSYFFGQFGGRGLSKLEARTACWACGLVTWRYVGRMAGGVAGPPGLVTWRLVWSIWRARAEQAGGADGLLGLRPGDLALRGPHGWGRGWATRPRDLALGWLSDVAFGVTINM